MWLWPATVAPLGPLAWEPPYASGVVLKSKKKKIMKVKSQLVLLQFYFKDAMMPLEREYRL